MERTKCVYARGPNTSMPIHESILYSPPFPILFAPHFQTSNSIEKETLKDQSSGFPHFAFAKFPRTHVVTTAFESLIAATLAFSEIMTNMVI